MSNLKIPVSTQHIIIFGVNGGKLVRVLHRFCCDSLVYRLIGQCSRVWGQ